MNEVRIRNFENIKISYPDIGIKLI
jgi:hypothetical protein